ncbi:hypothetical protein GLOIN_2v1543479 [Rhizophagus clarus]|uniref:Uncharacterized protein n=1 Tax=Rhizophagus clarus TaxID=94130 RepID=A0A8H3LY03_9GLOM|nr:hypothetical protein GLOIN_2v1543479 [Rhizophagus clarus]
MKYSQKLRLYIVYIIYIQFICSIACLIQDVLFLANLKAVIDLSRFSLGFFILLIYYIFVDVFCMIFNGNSAIIIARKWHLNGIKWDHAIFMFEFILWTIYVILKLVSWNGRIVSFFDILGLESEVTHYLGTLFLGFINLSLYITCYILNGTTWTNELIE